MNSSWNLMLILLSGFVNTSILLERKFLTANAQDVPEVEIWTYGHDSSTKPCIMVSFIVRLNINYGIIEGTYDLPAKQSRVVSGNCGVKTQNILIEWTDKNHRNAMKLKFNLKLAKESSYSLDEIAFEISTSLFAHNDNTTLKLLHLANDFTTWLHWSYLCPNDRELPLYHMENMEEPVAIMEVSHIHLEAFHVQNKMQFSRPIKCDTGLSTGQIIAISISSVLIAVILIGTLIWFYCWRNRYQSGYIRI
ncbi:lysosome-associated membrane glycoprotein 5-like [Sitodiplosis mosellana]|uniref:lysosome-associated membrane glycoprotein 5-like n=1 Tax=Sitodiplosis mosellana TaxID=263140 RepID=UPI00244473A9|nr:lysosome-associated membrane glycoprotein 5-like [Sitodiplosis mosellana]